jgi:hypothetical protein
MESKALGQLHFKYYAEVKELQRMYSKSRAHMFIDPLEGNVLYCHCGVFVHLLFFSSRTFFITWKEGVRVIH